MAERRIKIRRDFWFLDLQGFNSCLTLPLIVQIKKLRPRAVLLKANSSLRVRSQIGYGFRTSGPVLSPSQPAGSENSSEVHGREKSQLKKYVLFCMGEKVNRLLNFPP